MLLTQSRFMALSLMLSACSGSEFNFNPPGSTSSEGFTYQPDGTGGYDASHGSFVLPFPSGEYWQVTQTYNTFSHVDYDFPYGDDSFALDFAQGGCDAYGKPVTPVKSGTVMKITHDDGTGRGYGNSILIDHGGDLVSRYAHLSSMSVEEGDQVDTNTHIGHVGDTGFVRGSVCPEHPGTHLHLAVYYKGEGVKPEPLSGITPVTSGCWISREGWESCNGDPGAYPPTDGNQNVAIQMVDVAPDYGTARETDFIWMTQIMSPEYKPEATLHIHNERDGRTYDFQMETRSRHNPWIFVYQKSLRDDGDYKYWITAESNNGSDLSSHFEMEVEPYEGDAPEIRASTIHERSDYYQWEVLFWSYDQPETQMGLLKPTYDRVTYSDMNLESLGGSSWISYYNGSITNPWIVPTWMEVDNGASVSTTPVEWVTGN